MHLPRGSPIKRRCKSVGILVTGVFDLDSHTSSGGGGSGLVPVEATDTEWTPI